MGETEKPKLRFFTDFRLELSFRILNPMQKFAEGMGLLVFRQNFVYEIGLFRWFHVLVTVLFGFRVMRKPKRHKALIIVNTFSLHCKVGVENATWT